MPPQQPLTADWSMFRPGRLVVVLLAVNVVAYVIEMILIRSGVLTPGGSPLSLVPEEFFHGQLWQVATSVLLHSPVGTGHLLSNMLFLWVFGTSLEREEGGGAVLRAYVVGGLAGSAVALVLGLTELVVGSGVLGIFDGLWSTPTLGASGACMAVAFVWLARHYYEVLNFLFIGPVRGRTLMFVMILIEFLNMLSLSNVSWGAHLGGIGAGLVIGFGWWRPSTFRKAMRRRELARKGKRLERELTNLQVIEGGKDKPQGRQGDEWIH